MLNDDFSYILSQLGEEDKSVWQGAMSPPIYQTGNFSYSSFAAFRDAIREERKNCLYSRGLNPTVRLLEQKLAALQGTEDALCFGSGSAAIAAAVIAFCKQGDHVVCVNFSYSWTQKLLRNLLSRYGVSSDFVNGSESSTVENAIRNDTRMLILESPNSFLFELQDLRALCQSAKSRGVMVLCDNSYAGPMNRFPAEIGVDLIAHSATKYISGHSDTIAGVLCGNKALLDVVFADPYMTLGAALSPFNAWLLLRGLRTLELRVDRSGNSALAIASWLQKRPEVKRVNYPWLVNHKQRELAIQQLGRPMGMFSFELKSGEARYVEEFCNSLSIFQMAVSWGGYESLVFPSALFDPNPFPEGLIRMSIGLENPDLLKEDLEKAFFTSAKFA
jgi:cystathionine beta-lyase/cystathionine gamma-synthase